MTRASGLCGHVTLVSISETNRKPESAIRSSLQHCRPAGCMMKLEFLVARLSRGHSRSSAMSPITIR